MNIVVENWDLILYIAIALLMLTMLNMLPMTQPAAASRILLIVGVAAIISLNAIWFLFSNIESELQSENCSIYFCSTQV
jgi:hypothetical protein